jgi:hypothetical protein
MKPCYKIHNINGRFDHVRGKTEAVNRANEIEGTQDLTAAELIRDYGWAITRVSEAHARSVGL